MSLENLTREEKEAKLRLYLMKEAVKGERRLRDYKPNSGFQEEFFKSRAAVRAIMSGNQGGKALEDNEPVLTPDGWVRIGDLRVGDYVYGEEGKPCLVTGVHPQGVRDIYEVSFDDGNKVKCTLDHLWSTVSRRWQKSARKVLTTEEILKRGFRAKSRVLVPMTRPVEFQYRDVLIDAYTLGVLLGDGGMTGDLRFSTSDGEMLSFLKLNQECYFKKLNKYDYGIRSRVRNNPMIDALRFYKLLGCKPDKKFIPRDYLYNSIEVRLSVLQGLLDTDGTVSKHSGYVTYSTSSLGLANDVVFIVQSLGGKAKIKKKISNINTESYKVSVRLPRTRLFRLERKQKFVFDPKSTCDERVIVGVEKIGRAKATCISVNSLYSTFLTKDFIVTHNTHAGSVESALYALGEHPHKRIRTPNIGWIITAKKLEEGIENDILPKLRAVVGSRDIVDIKNDKQGKPYKVIWRSGSVSYFKSAEQKDMTFEGTTLDWAWFDEPSRRELYVAVSRGLMKSNGHLWYTCTLIEEPWIYEEIYLKGLDPKQPDFEVFIGSTDENVHLSNEGKEKFFSRLTPDEIETRRHGRPSNLSGRVFKTYDPEKHRIEPFDVPRHWPVWAAIDPHRNKPHAVCFLTASPQGILYVINEIFTKCTIKELAHYTKDLGDQYNMIDYLIDTSAQEDGWGSLSAREILELEGLSTRLAQKKNLKSSGLFKINQLFQEDKLFVFNTCLRMHRELTLQTYKKSKTSVSEEVEKRFDDMTDALRYIIVRRPEYQALAPIYPGPYERTRYD